MGTKKIETYEQKEKALKWMVEMAEHPLNPVIEDPKTAKIYAATEKAVQEFNERNIPTLHDDLEKEPIQEPESQKEEPVEDEGSWL